MRRSLLHFFFVFSFVILFSCYFPVLGHAQTSPSLDFTVVPSQNEYAKPPNEDAKGRLDITITPKGKIDNIVRPPIDVVFVFDISGSMDELGTDPMKFQSAKQALASSIHYFKANANPSDRFALVPFSDGVKYDRVVPFPSGVYNVSSHLETILKTANGLVAGGGTNYLAALQTAQSFFDDSTRKKYVIFLTDGEPTVSKVKEEVTYEVCEGILLWRKCYNQTANLDVEYRLFSDGITSERVIYYPSGRQSTLSRNSTDYAKYKEKIRSHALNMSKELGSSNVTLYSIGFGNNRDVDLNYLERLSAITGGIAKQGTTQNLVEIFHEFSKLAIDPVLSGTIRIPLHSFDGKVQIFENGNVWIDDAKTNAYISFNVNYNVGQSTPSPINVSVPIAFKEKGTYTLNAEMVYRDVYGVTQPSINKQVTIVVKDEVPPTFDGKVELQGVSHDVSALIKYGNTNGDSNQFVARYTLIPSGYVGSGKSGYLSNIKIIQPLPQGVTTVASSQNVNVYTKDGTMYAELLLPDKKVDYKELNNTLLNVDLKLQVNWAMDAVQLPRATVSFEDSIYGLRSSVLPIASKLIGMKVRLLEFPNIYYEGDSRGLVSKWQTLPLTTNLIAETKHPNDYGLRMLPIQSLSFKPGSDDYIILVTYKDGESVELNLKPQLKILKSDNVEIPSGSVVTEPVKVRIVGFVAGENVSYQYQMANLKQNINWSSLVEPYEIPITVDGLTTVSVKSFGGFTKEPSLSSVFVTYNKLISSIRLEYNRDMNVGDEQIIRPVISPIDATNQQLQWSSSDPNIATIDQQGKVVAKRPGVVNITVRTLDGSNLYESAQIRVIDPIVLLEGIRFKRSILYVTVGTKVYLNEEIEFIPSNATNRKIDMSSSSPSYVAVFEQNEKWVLEAKELGYATITARARDNEMISASMLVIVRDRNLGDEFEDKRNKW